jgi:hypothetical protein
VIVNDVLKDIGEGLSALGSDWTKYTVIGSFLLYVAGYLSIRFHLTAIGIGTDLAVLDERYLFAGARFLVYLVASVPSMLMLFLPLAAIAWGVSKSAPSMAAKPRHLWNAHPLPLVWLSIVVAIVVIQFVMRQCFFLSNLLLARALPTDPAWLVGLLLDDRLMPLYFGGLIVACAFSLVVLFALRDIKPRHAGVAMTCGTALLAFLAAVQVLLLPVNYGILIMDKTFPRVGAIGAEAVAGGANAWLVWEGKNGVTFLLRRPDGDRVLLTIPLDEARRIEIRGFDPIIPTLFGPKT